MNNRAVVALRSSILTMMIGSAIGAVASWFYMSRWGAVTMSVVSLFTQLAYIKLWLLLEKFWRELTEYQQELDRILTEYSEKMEAIRNQFF